MTDAEFAQLYRSHATLLTRQLRRQFPEQAGEAEDVVHDAFGKLWRRCAPGSSTCTECPDSPAAWLYRAANNAMIDRVRAMRRRSTEATDASRPSTGRSADPGWTYAAAIAPESGDPDQSHADQHDVLMRVLRSLPERDRHLLVMKYIDGLSYDEIAERTGYSRASLGTLLLRARRNAQQRIVAAVNTTSAVA